jgi:hypothetical protein
MQGVQNLNLRYHGNQMIYPQEIEEGSIIMSIQILDRLPDACRFFQLIPACHPVPKNRHSLRLKDTANQRRLPSIQPLKSSSGDLEQTGHTKRGLITMIRDADLLLPADPAAFNMGVEVW